MKRFFLIVLFAFFSTAYASPDEPKENIDYVLLKTPLPVENPKKVEVIEFFGYYCPHCYSLDQTMVQWKEKHLNDVTFKRVHVKFNDYMQGQQKIFYTLSSLGKLSNPLHHALFHAVQTKRIDFNNEKTRLALAKELGIDQQTFLKTYESDAVATSCQNAETLQEIFQFEGVPCLIVDGKYLTSLSIVAEGNQFAGTEEEAQQLMLKIIDHLIDRELKNRPKEAKITKKSLKSR